MSVVFMADPASGKVALFDEAPGGGSYSSTSSNRNRPLLNPQSWLDNIYFHSDLDNLEVIFDRMITVSHAAVAGQSVTTALSAPADVIAEFSVDAEKSLKFKAASADRLLLTHGLGYVPDFLAAVGSNVLTSGMPVQALSDGRGRYASVYATSTEIRLYEWSSVSSSALPATDLDYRVLVFKDPPAPSGNLLIDFNPVTGVLKLARGRFDSSRNYLQVVPGGTPFGIAYGKTMDLKNGAVRLMRADGSKFDPVLSTQAMAFSVTYGGGGRQFNAAVGGSMAYNGSAVAPTRILVQAP